MHTGRLPTVCVVATTRCSYGPRGYASGLWSRGGTVWGDMVPGGMIPQGGHGPPCGQTDTCKKHYLPETSFAGGNKKCSNSHTLFSKPYFIEDICGMYNPGHCT